MKTKNLVMIVTGLFGIGVATEIIGIKSGNDYALKKGESAFIETFPVTYKGMTSDSTFKLAIHGIDSEYTAKDGVVFDGKVKYSLTKMTPESLALVYDSNVKK